ncbi:nuclear transport factor 2 family protein [Streptomyces violaceus]|uniref:nuclear transport factor 2 family protein n=1 Tax=Streptomyces violaceus TaxID=1936 RepID=UPI00381555E4
MEFDRTAPTSGATVQPSADQRAREEILDAHRAYLDAMDEGDTKALDDLLDDSFTLTHMTGYVQPKAEWLAQIRQDRFVYHAIDEKKRTLDIDGDWARLVARTVTDATVYGTRADWRLKLATDYARQDDTWATVRTVATTW